MGLTTTTVRLKKTKVDESSRCRVVVIDQLKQQRGGGCSISAFSAASEADFYYPSRDGVFVVVAL